MNSARNFTHPSLKKDQLVAVYSIHNEGHNVRPPSAMMET